MAYCMGQGVFSLNMSFLKKMFYQLSRCAWILPAFLFHAILLASEIGKQLRSEEYVPLASVQQPLGIQIIKGKLKRWGKENQ
jgi:hypothetical protein